MGVVITDAELAELQSLYPLHKFDAGFTRQQEQFALYHLKGLSASQAATAAGYKPSYGAVLLRDEKMQQLLVYLREKHFEDVRVTRDTLNSMLFDAHSKAATATEEIMAVRELGKMNGLYESDNKRGAGIEVNVNVGEIKNAKQIEKMDDAQLIELAQSDYHEIGTDASQ